ncbi:MAG: Glycogen synthase [Firmicutes bacterium ADurb.Bin182]|nr:MAG: Glycogen synthase [Firmicutes bacterium ADurb.Bin182]
MKVLYAASECVPFVKTGGLADVAGTLPLFLKERGADIRVILPKYRQIECEWKQNMKPVCSFELHLGWRKQYCGIESIEKDGVTFYFVDNEFYYARDSVYGSGGEDAERFSFFCRAVLEALPLLDFMPDILHLNDWHTGMIPVLLKTQYKKLPAYADIKTVFTIHNLRYQGIFDWMHTDDLLSLGGELFSPEHIEFYGKINFMKGGIAFSDAITTVSPSYAKEIMSSQFGEGLDGPLRSRASALKGILNGLDNKLHDPLTDPYLPSRYSCEDLSGKAECKRHLQERLGLAPRADVPLIGMVTRLTRQKGMGIVEIALEDIMGLDVQMAVIGSGDRRFEDLLRWASWRYPGKFADFIGYSDETAHLIYAGSDIFLMPSEFEPCGLAQMIALRYGSVPLVRETGGLKDTIKPYNEFTDEGNGFSFANYSAEDLFFTLRLALRHYADKPLWERLIVRAMNCDFSWEHPADEYFALYSDLLNAKEASDKPAAGTKKGKAKKAGSEEAAKKKDTKDIEQ